MKPVVVVDASVSVKWFVPQLPEEDDVSAALALLRAYAEDRVALYQPPLWRAEVLAVLARVSPEAAERHAWRFLSFDHEIADSPAVYLKAVALAIELGHHLFDTMYHAAALTHPNAMLITADERYRAKGDDLGKILPLPLWERVFE